MIKEAQYGRTRTIVCMYVCQRGSKVKSQYNEWSIESGDWYLTGAARWSRKGGIPVPEVCDGGSFIHSKWPGNSPWHHRTPNFGEFTLSVGLCVAHLVLEYVAMPKWRSELHHRNKTSECVTPELRVRNQPRWCRSPTTVEHPSTIRPSYAVPVSTGWIWLTHTSGASHPMGYLQ